MAADTVRSHINPDVLRHEHGLGVAHCSSWIVQWF
jgi:hypothetical protein